MRPLNLACAMLLAAACLPLRAQDADPLKSPACGTALASLQSARAQGESAERVEALRSAAATKCLGAGSPPSRPARVVQAPIAVPPPQIEPPPVPAPSLAMPAAPTPPVAIGRLPAPALCDATGCWSNDGGTHLRHVPPNLTSPLCSRLGGMVYCP